MTRVPTPHGDVTVRYDGPERGPLLVLAHGAGSDLTHPFMTAVAEELAEEGLRVCRFNFAYTEAGRKAPDRGPVLEETYLAVIEGVRGRRRGFHIGGKSMGGRIAAQVAPRVPGLSGLVFLGYPLHPPGRPERLRDEPLRNAGVPMLFVEGSRDPFCPLDTLTPILSELTDADLSVIEDGDHSFNVRRSSGRSTEDARHELVAAVARWVKG